MMVKVNVLLVVLVLSVLSFFCHVVHSWKLAVNTAPKGDPLLKCDWRRDNIAKPV